MLYKRILKSDINNLENVKDLRKIAATDWTNLKDPKVIEKYKELLPSKIEDSTGLVNPDSITNRLKQTPEEISSTYDRWLAEFDEINTNIDIDISTFVDALEVKETDPEKVVRDNPKKGGYDALSPYKMAAQQVNERLDKILTLRKGAYDESQILYELADQLTAKSKFIERFFGEEEVARRSRHYKSLEKVYNEVIVKIEEKGKDVIQKIIDTFTSINEQGKALFSDSKEFNYAAKKGNEFISKLKALKTAPGFKGIEDASRYLYNAILAGDALYVSAEIDKKGLKKLSELNKKIFKRLQKTAEPTYQDTLEDKRKNTPRSESQAVRDYPDPKYHNQKGMVSPLNILVMDYINSIAGMSFDEAIAFIIDNISALNDKYQGDIFYDAFSEASGGYLRKMEYVMKNIVKPKTIEGLIMYLQNAMYKGMSKLNSLIKSESENIKDLRKKATANLTEGERSNLEGIIISHISNYTKDVDDETLQYDLDLLEKLCNEKISIEYVRANFLS